MSLISNLFKDLVTPKGRPEIVSTTPHGRSVASHVALIREKWGAQELVAAEKLANEAFAQYPDSAELLQIKRDVEFDSWHAIILKSMPGAQYLEWLKWFHVQLKPANYLEIGVETGMSLQFTLPTTRAVGVDPGFSITHTQKNWVKLFKVPSDDFFADNDMEEVFGSKVINLSFIDGLHTFDQALKDFINVERHSDARSVALFHDILPIVPTTALRERNSTIWVGDTWKVMFILMKYRPDLKIFTIPTHPSGLGVATGLDKNSDILSKNFEQICEEAMQLDLNAFPNGIWEHMRVVENNFATVAGLLGKAA